VPSAANDRLAASDHAPPVFVHLDERTGEVRAP
jgi:hypothetical protein